MNTKLRQAMTLGLVATLGIGLLMVMWGMVLTQHARAANLGENDFYPDANTLIGYYWTGTQEQIISIDATTGVTSVIATLDLDWVGSGFTVDSINHKAYLAGQKNGETFWRLYNTDLATGEVVSTTILDTGQGGFGFAAYAANTLIGTCQAIETTGLRI